MGPVGNIIIEEKLGEMGHTAFNMPMAKAPELISLLAQSIPDGSESKSFARTMNSTIG